MGERKDSVQRRTKSAPVHVNRHFDGRPVSFELETDFTNTETKLVVLDFLSSQPIEHLTARNARRKTLSFDSSDRHRIKSSLGKSTSDGANHESYRNRYAKLAESGKSLRKQYSLRLRRDLDEYLKLRGKSMDDLSGSLHSGVAISQSGDLENYQHQRSYTEGEAYYRLRSRSPIRSDGVQETSKKKPRRKISRELKEGIVDFDQETLRHVEVPEVNRMTASMDNDV